MDVVEVVGHTDDQPIGVRQSNLDRDLLPVLKNEIGIASIVPADNAGLGLARAASVVSVLRQNVDLAKFKILPLSGGQLVDTDETLAISGAGGNIAERRRIEIRLRKANPAAVKMQHPPTIPVSAPPNSRSRISPIEARTLPPPRSLVPPIAPTPIAPPALERPDWNRVQ